MSLVAADPAIGARHRPLAVAALFLAAFMNILDVTIVNLALPAIRTELNATTTQLEWVLIIYVLTFAAGLLPFGRFGDSFGRKRVFCVGVGGFLGSSVVCGLAPDIQTLIVARAVQGLTAAMMIPQVLAIVHVIFSAEEKGKVIGLFGTVNALGAVAGPLLGGVLITANIAGLGWRPIFLMNVPFCLLSLIIALRFVPRIEVSVRTRPDWTGAVLFAAAIGCVIYPLTEGRHLGWPWWCFGLIVLAAALAALFVHMQMLHARLGLSQILPAKLISDSAFMRGLVIVTAFFSGIAGIHFMLAIVLQSGFALTPLQAGLATAPHPIGVMIASTLTGRLGNRWLQMRMVVGGGLLLVGMVWVRSVLGQNSADITFADLFLPMLVVGLGMGTAIAAMFQSVLIRVSPADAGAGSGVLQAAQQVGIAVGIGIVGQIFFATLDPSESRTDYVRAAQTALLFPVGIYLLLVITGVWNVYENKRSRHEAQRKPVAH
ncbi:MFS transporter [Roseibium sp. HPY-6]|uniref:MFS transporter n=1 Tax=Roseibium sp. HPY-6 TaxID=3229852 RepID=UPI00339045F2